MERARFRVILAFVLASSATATADDWPHWRGPTRDGRTNESSAWNGKGWIAEQPAWKASVGVGGGGPLVVGDRVYVFGHEKGSDVLRCLGTKDGQPIWATRNKAPLYGRFHEGDEGLYSGPSSTPEYDLANGYVYTLGADGDLRCLDANDAGKQLWHRNLYADFAVERRPKLTRAPRRDYGYTTSPFVHGDVVIVEVGSTTRGTLIAFDKKTGKESWASDLRDEAGHTGGPTPIRIAGVDCLAIVTQRNLAAIRLDAGNEGKTAGVFPWITDFANTIAGPAVQGDSAVVTSAYNQNAMCRVRFRLNGADEVWRVRTPSKVCTPIIHNGSLYFAWQRVRCLDWESGAQKWEGGTFGDPGSCAFTSDERLIVYGRSGKLALVEGAGRSPKAYRELATRDGIFRSEAWPHVAVAGGRIFCRDREGNLVAFSLLESDRVLP